MSVSSTPEPLTDFSPGFLSCFTTYLPINSVSLAELGSLMMVAGLRTQASPWLVEKNCCAYSSSLHSLSP